MKKTAFISAIALAALAASASAPLLTHAQSSDIPDSVTVTTNQTTGESSSDIPSSVNVTSNKVTGQPASAGTNTGVPPMPGPNDTYGWLMTNIMSLFAALTGIAGLALEDAVYYGVVHMGAIVHGLTAIGIAWRILRDLGNLVLIFGFIAIGISIILDVNWYGGGTKFLPTLLIVAVFLNFSLFFAETVIDIGNVFATQFYTQINGGKVAAPVGPLSPNNIENEGISNKIMNQIGLTTLYDEANNTSNANTNIFSNSGSSLWVLGFLGIILFIITAFVMFSLAFVLIARMVILILLIIVAPLGFAGLAVPNLQGTAKKWWNYLIQQTFTAPALLLTLYVALAVISDQKFLTGFMQSSGQGILNPNTVAGVANSVWTGWITNPTATTVGDFAGAVLSFVIAMGLLMAALFVARSMSAFGANWATKMGGKLSFGVVGWTARNTAGRGFDRASRSWKNSRLSQVPVLGKSISNVLDRGAKGSFDVRGTQAFKQTAAAAKIDAGKPQEGGFRKEKEDRGAANKQYAQQTAVGRLKQAIATRNQSEANKIMRSLDDPTFLSPAVQNIIPTSDVAVKALTNSQAGKLSDSTISKPTVYQNLSPAKLEAVRHAGNIADSTAQTIGLQILRTNAAFATWYGALTGNQLRDVKSYWNLP